jgi:hypothetical protein
MIISAIHLVLFMLINLVVVLAGYQLIKKATVFFSWMLLLVGIIAIIIVCLHDAPVVRMFYIIITTFTDMKVITAVQSYKGKPVGITFKQWAIFATGWMGMRPQPFETLGGKALPNARPMIIFGLRRAIAGICLIFLAHVLVSFHVFHNLTYMVVSIVLLIADSLILHFGLLGISAGMWRLKGANTYTLFRQPAKSTSLAELWGKRWNIAFSEMTSVAIYRPLKNKIGPGGALMVSFIFSGLLHELALSVPVNSGYGLPTVYFIIQGIMILVENALVDNKITILQNKLFGRVWTFFWVIVPVPLLFHTQFIQQVVWPLAGLHP